MTGAAVIGIVTAQIVLDPATPDPGLAGLIRAYAEPAFQLQSLTILVLVMAMFVALLTLGVQSSPVAASRQRRHASRQRLEGDDSPRHHYAAAHCASSGSRRTRLPDAA